jgi:sec-independent protein translocase protein TatC
MPLEGHLDELRSRLIVSLAVFGVALALCFWQNHLLLEIASGPLPDNHGRLITFSVTEPFTTTMKVAAYGAVILSLPILLYELYAFFLPAVSAQQRKTVTPLLMLTPVLFLAGVVFAYFVVVPAALNFLLNFNDSQFNVQLKASEYYGFMATTLIACGIVFEVPVAILGATRLGVINVAQLRKNRRYAYLVCAIVAAALPGVDPISMLLETAPLIALYEVSIVLARIWGTPSESAEPSPVAS